MYYIHMFARDLERGLVSRRDNQDRDTFEPITSVGCERREARTGHSTEFQPPGDAKLVVVRLVKLRECSPGNKYRYAGGIEARR